MADEEKTQSNGDAEVRAYTFVVDGKPMSFEEMKAYRAEKEARAKAAAAAADKTDAEEARLRALRQPELDRLRAEDEAAQRAKAEQLKRDGPPQDDALAV